MRVHRLLLHLPRGPLKRAQQAGTAPVASCASLASSHDRRREPLLPQCVAYGLQRAATTTRNAQHRAWATPGRAYSAQSTGFASACTLMGRRPYQEDRYNIAHITPDLSFFACYDGHGGDEAAEYANTHLHVLFKEKLAEILPYQECLRAAIEKVDADFVATGATSGTTAVVAILRDDQLVVGHVGDSKCLLCHEGKVVELTQDHKPSVQGEYDRILGTGADVFIDADGDSRVNARLAMSRSIGDVEFKAAGVIAEPDILSREISEKDCFFVLMTDGVSDALNAAQVCAVVNSCADPEEAAQELVSLAAQLGSMDNITALVVRLPGWGKFDNPEDLRLRQQAYTYNRGSRFRPLSLSF